MVLPPFSKYVYYDKEAYFWSIFPLSDKTQDLFNALGSMYAAVLFIGIQNGQTVQPIVDVERTVFYREKAAGMYSALPYAFAQVYVIKKKITAPTFHQPTAEF